MSPEIDYYGILQVEHDAPAELIETSYRTLARSMRGRASREPESPRAALLHEAYRILSDPAERERYDRQLRSTRRSRPTVVPDSEPENCLFCGASIPAEVSNAQNALCECCSSPVARATRHRFEHSMRRMFRRIERRQKIRVYTKWGDGAIAGTMHNLSRNGMRFTSASEFRANQLIKIDSEMCKALARVCYCVDEESGEFATGVEFVTTMFS